MPTSYPAEFRRRAIALVRSGWSVTKTAHDLDVTTTTIYNWVMQDRIDRGELPGISTKESKELVRARRRIRELEAEVEILRRAHQLLGKEVVRPKGFTR
jgi:transposase